LSDGCRLKLSRRSIVRTRVAFASVLLLAAGAARGQQPAGAPPASTGAIQPAIIVYRIDLDPTGTVFAMNEPVLEGDTYTFRSLPERLETRLPKSKVKAVKRWSTDVEKEVVWQVELAGSGKYLIRDEPVKKGKNYVLTTWKNGTLMSAREEDVLGIQRLTGREAWKAEMTALGVVVLKGETTEAGFRPDAPGQPGAAPAGSNPPGAQGPGNWTYQGQPGASDAYAPGSGQVQKPGDVPMAPTPR
jgi:hypothetical protein